MIERVARAIKAEIGKAFAAKPLLGDAASGDWHAEGGTLDLEVVARAAIEAMYEPTEAMIVGGVTTDVETARTADGDGRCLTPGLIWRTMIDEALK